MSKMKIRKITLSAILMSIGLVLPFITMQIPTIGVMLSPLHVPVLLAGFVVGPLYASIIGFILPIIRGLLFMIPRFPNAFYMAFELATYGLVSGLVFNKLFKNLYTYKNVYLSLIIAMVAGRVAYGIVKYIAFKYVLMMSAYTLTIWMSDVVLSSIPGIVIQLVLIPALVMVLYQRGELK